MAKKETALQEDPVMDVNAEAEKILAEARAKAAEIVSAAEKEAEEAVKATKEAASGTDEDMVAIRLFKDNERYKDDVFVAVNGKTWQIKRGETVTIPKYVADVLEQSLKQDTATANMIDRQSAEYEAKAKALNI